MQLENGYSENVDVDEGLDPATGIRTVLKFEGDQIIVQKTQDMEPILRHVQAMRERNDGKNWGEGREVGYIPPIFYDRICLIKDRKERAAAVKSFFRQNPAFCAYAPYLK